MKVLHLSDTQLSGSPQRISALLSKYGGIESRHYVWKSRIGFREFPVDMCLENTRSVEIRRLIYEWADIIHYHNRWKRQEIFSVLGEEPPKKPSVIQIHSPRDSEDFSGEIKSGIPIACPAQYHSRQWPMFRYLVPNVVDIYDPQYMRDKMPIHERPCISYAPSNTNARGWDDKSYGVVAPVLKRMRLRHEVIYDLIDKKPFSEVMAMKKRANIGIDEISTGSYHLSSLEYLSLGVPCFANIDALTEKAVKDVTGCSLLPWIIADKDCFETTLKKVVNWKTWLGTGAISREWMEKYWNPGLLCKRYIDMYEDLT